MFTRQPSEARAGNAPSGLVRLGQGAAVQPTIGGLDWLSSAARAPGLKRDGVVTPGGASGYPTTLESLSHVADSLHTRRGRCETGEKETLRISTDHAGFFSYVVPPRSNVVGNRSHSSICARWRQLMLHVVAPAALERAAAQRRARLGRHSRGSRTERMTRVCSGIVGRRESPLAITHCMPRNAAE